MVALYVLCGMVGFVCGGFAAHCVHRWIAGCAAQPFDAWDVGTHTWAPPSGVDVPWVPVQWAKDKERTDG